MSSHASQFRRMLRGERQPDPPDVAAIDRIEPAWARVVRWARGGLRVGRNGEVRGSGLVALRIELDARRKRFEAGRAIELLHVVRLCAEESLPLPDWASSAFIERLDSIWGPDGPRSLDEVFSLGTRAEIAERKRWRLGAELWVQIAEIAGKHTALDPALTEVLERRDWKVGKTQARKLVLLVDRNQAELTGSQTLSDFWSKVRKR